jgi:MerR family transcriptional regulator, redox-sensitive transcriptional activator SoxR
MGAAPTRGARFREALLASRRQSLAQRFFRSLQGHGIGVGNGEGVKGRVHVTRIESIQAVSRRSGVVSSALRYYEERGLIASQRARSGHRRYPRAALRRIAFIVYAQRIGLSLEEIGAELAKLPDDRTPTRADWSRMSGAWTKRIDQKIAELQRLRAGLTQCIGCGCLSIDKCEYANPADRAGRRGPGPRYWLK